MKILIEHGANVNVADNDGHTPLHVAALKGSYRQIRDGTY